MYGGYWPLNYHMSGEFPFAVTHCAPGACLCFKMELESFMKHAKRDTRIYVWNFNGIANSASGFGFRERAFSLETLRTYRNCSGLDPLPLHTTLGLYVILSNIDAVKYDRIIYIRYIIIIKWINKKIMLNMKRDLRYLIKLRYFIN